MQSPARISTLVLALVSLPASHAVAQRTPQPPAPVTEAESAVFVATLLERARAADCTAIEAMFDVHAIVMRGIEGLPLRGTELMSLETSIGRQYTEPNIGIVPQFCAGPASIRVVHRGRGVVEAIPVERFRMDIVGGGSMFADLVLGRSRTGAPVIVDALLPAQDSSLSMQVRDTAIPLGASDSPFARSLDERGRLRARHYATLREVLEATSAGDVARVDAAVSRLPPELAEEPFVLMLRVKCASFSGDSTSYRAALDDFLRLHPTSAAANLLAIDAYTLRRDYDGAIRAIDRVEAVVGHDHFLTMTRGLLLATAHRLPEAYTTLLAAVAGDPDLTRAWELLLDLGIRLDHFDVTVRSYVELRRLGAVPVRVHADAVYARLRATAEYRATGSATATTSTPMGSASSPQGGSSQRRQR